MAYVLLVRHGQNDWVNKKRLAGWTPGVHLNEKGREQVSQLAGRLKELPIKAVYSSPLVRCTETAAAIAQLKHLEVTEVEALGEVRYGRWEGRKIKKLSKKKAAWYAVQHFPSRFSFPGGEALRSVQQRAVTALEELGAHHDKEMFVAVSHADVIKLVLAHYLGVHIDLFQRIEISPAGVSVLALSPSGPVRILRINDDGPLRPPPEQDKDKKQRERKESHDAIVDERTSQEEDAPARTPQPAMSANE